LKVDKFDSVFSKIIRSRDNWTCVRPKCKKQHLPPTNALHNSHYFGRTRYSTRFDEENCDALCHGCHRYWELSNREEYRDFKIKQLGEDGFYDLRRRSESLTKKNKVLTDEFYKQLKDRLNEI